MTITTEDAVIDAAYLEWFSASENGRHGYRPSVFRAGFLAADARARAEVESACRVPLTAEMAHAQADLFNEWKSRAETAEAKLVLLTALLGRPDQ